MRCVTQQVSRGANTPVPTATVRAVLSWRTGPAVPDVDASALLLGAAGRVRADEDFVFSDQPVHPSGTLRHEGRTSSAGHAHDSVTIDLAAMAPEVDRVVIAASAGGGGFGQVPELQLQLLDEAGTALVVFAMREARSETALVAGELYRRGGGWKLRAVGQGYDSGLAGLATDFGIRVDDPQDGTPRQPAPSGPLPPARPAPPGSATGSGGAGALRLTTGEERLPAEMRRRLSLRKQEVALSLRKAGADGLTARVVLVLDASGSMGRLYARGTVASVVERMAAVAAQLDDDGLLQAWTFASNPARLPDLQVGDMPQWISLHVRVGEMKLFGRRRQLAPGQVDMAAVGIQNEEQKVIADVRSHVRAHPEPVPTLVLFFSDGGVYRNAEIEQQLRAAVDEPVFWQFVGVGNARFGVLEQLDTLTGRRVDNVGFFRVADLDSIDDADLYDRLLREFPTWVRAARTAGILS